MECLMKNDFLVEYKEIYLYCKICRNRTKNWLNRLFAEEYENFDNK